MPKKNTPHKSMLQIINKFAYKFASKYLCSFANLKDNYFRRVGNWRHGNAEKAYIGSIFPEIKKVDIQLLKTFDYVIDMSIDPLELLSIIAIIKLKKPKTLCEIGTYDGKTTLNMACNAPDDSIIYTIDLPQDWDGNFKIELPVEWKNNIQLTDTKKMKYRYLDTKYEKKIYQVYCDSAKLDWKQLKTKFDLIFIDGCHYKKYVEIDTKNAFEYLNKDGVIIWHDYGMFKDVSEAVDSFAELIDIKQIHGTRLAIGQKK